MIRLPRSRILVLLPLLAILAGASMAVAKPHAIAFGKWTTVQWLPDTGDAKPVTLKVRGLFVDGKLKEYTLGPAHEVTERLFVVRRAFRVNDSLPEESGSAPRWQWQRGGWLLVDRVTGHVSQVNLPEFDLLYSTASWYRDYAAYCGVSDDGKKFYAMVAQLGRRKPVLKKPLAGSEVADDAPPDSSCPAPAWQRGPARVMFELAAGNKQTFAIRGHVVDLVNETEEEEEAAR
ncbi:MAG: hypothetical protein WB562_04070 [Candidatus Sulfotelmatobacter sp.]